MEGENMAVQDQEMGMMNIPLESTPAANGNTTHVPTGSPAVSRSLPELYPPKVPPKGSDNRRCLEWSCGTIACAILFCIVMPVVMFVIVAIISSSGGFDNTGSFDPNRFLGTN